MVLFVKRRQESKKKLQVQLFVKVWIVLDYFFSNHEVARASTSTLPMLHEVSSLLSHLADPETISRALSLRKEYKL